jgi:CelD/BcsL family acetyltransferase involved in cellulose biosynthesis
MIRFRLSRPEQLTADDWALWDQIQRSSIDFESPYFRPEFTRAVAAVRDDVEVVVIEEQGRTAGFFPFQRSALNLGKPVGGKLSDFHGVIVPRGFRVDARQLMQAARLAAWDFDHLHCDQPSFDAFTTATQEATYLDLSRGFEAYCEERKRAGSQAIRKTLSKERRFKREVGHLHFDLASDHREVLDTLIEWKIAQFERTGFMNLFAFPWTRRLLESLLDGPPELRGILSVLWFGMEPIGISYNLCSYDVAHSWFLSYNQEYATHSPGMMMMVRMAEACAAQGFRRIHLGAGDQRFKQGLANGSVTVGVGTVEAPTLGIMLRDAWRWSRDTAASLPGLSYCTAPAALLQPMRRWIAFR